MPRTASPQVSRFPAGGGRFASPAVRALFRRRAAECISLFFALAGLALLLALASYNPADPSLSTASGKHAANLVGPVGAILADFLLQWFGFAGVLPALCLLTWAWRLASQRGFGHPYARLISIGLAVPFAAATLATIPVSAHAPAFAGPGGAAGIALSGTIVGGLGSAFGPMGGLFGSILLVGVSGAAAFIALGLSVGDWGRAAKAAGKAARGTSEIAMVGVEAAWSRVPSLSTTEPTLPPRDTPRASVVRDTPEWRPAATVPEGTGIAARLMAPFRSLFGGQPQRHHRPSSDLRSVLEAADERSEGIRVPPFPEAARDPGRAGEARLQDPAMVRPLRHPAPPDAQQDRLATPPADVRQVAPRRQPQAAPQPLQRQEWRLPPLSLLAAAPAMRSGRPSNEALQENARTLEGVLEDYGVRGRITEVRPGPVVTLYELEPAPGTKSARVIGLADDIARNMHVTAVRIATVPGRNVIGIEMPNSTRETVYLSELLGCESWARDSGRLGLALGKDIGGVPVITDLARMPHLLIAGTTGSGKSVAVNTMILSLLYRHSPDECRFIMIDPKMLELSVYDRIPHLLAPVVTEPSKAIGALKWTVKEMEKRYRAMSQVGVRNITGYNEKLAEARAKGQILTRRVQTGFDPETGKPVFEEQPLPLDHLPMIVVIIDEVADLMLVAGKDIEAAVQRLAQMARAAGIHVVMATQRPSVDVITGTIKANFPTRISFQVTSKIDSRTILGEMGAEQLLGQGDMLHMAGGGRISRVHGPFVSDQEVERVVEFLRDQGEPSYVDEVTENDEELDDADGAAGGGGDAGEKGLFEQAVALVMREGKCSTSFIQRHLSIGYNRAAKLVEQMEKDGIVGPSNHVGKREVLSRRGGED